MRIDVQRINASRDAAHPAPSLFARVQHAKEIAPMRIRLTREEHRERARLRSLRWRRAARPEYLIRHQSDGAHRMREIAYNWIGPVRIKVNASQIAVAIAGAAQSEDRSAKQKTTFFDSIDPTQTSAHI